MSQVAPVVTCRLALLFKKQKIVHSLIYFIHRFAPTRAPAPWDDIKTVDTIGPVCPQRLPDISNETLALERMPKGRLEYLRRLLPRLKNQSEDCLYMNIYTPVQGEFILLCLITADDNLLMPYNNLKMFGSVLLFSESLPWKPYK